MELCKSFWTHIESYEALTESYGIQWNLMEPRRIICEPMEALWRPIESYWILRNVSRGTYGIGNLMHLVNSYRPHLDPL